MTSDEHSRQKEAEPKELSVTSDAAEGDSQESGQLNCDSLPSEVAKTIYRDYQSRLTKAREHQTLLLPRIQAELRARILSMADANKASGDNLKGGLNDSTGVEGLSNRRGVFEGTGQGRGAHRVSSVPNWRLTAGSTSDEVAPSVSRVRCARNIGVRQWQGIVPPGFRPAAAPVMPMLDAAPMGISFPEFVVEIDGAEISEWAGEIRVAVDANRRKLLVNTDWPQSVPSSSTLLVHLAASKGDEILWAVELSQASPSQSVDYQPDLHWEGVEFTLLIKS
jgi:hypothetical protein